MTRKLKRFHLEIVDLKEAQSSEIKTIHGQCFPSVNYKNMDLSKVRRRAFSSHTSSSALALIPF